MSIDDDLLGRVRYWEDKFSRSLQEQISLRLVSNPDVDINEVRATYFLNKLAVLMVANEALKEQIRAGRSGSVTDTSDPDS